MTITNALFVGTLATWQVLELWRVLREGRRPVRATALADRGTRLLVNLGTYVGLLLAFLASRLRDWRMPGGDTLDYFVVGMVLIWAGLALRQWSIRTLGRFFRSTVVIQQGHRLVTEGPYRYLRHPSYAGALLALLGIGIVLGNWLSLAALLLPLLALLRRIQVEEAALRSGLGDQYRAYARSTSRLVPLIW